MTTPNRTNQAGRKLSLTVYLTEAELERIDRMAKGAERSRSDWTRRALIAALEKMEACR